MTEQITRTMVEDLLLEKIKERDRLRNYRTSKVIERKEAHTEIYNTTLKMHEIDDQLNELIQKLKGD